MKVMLQAAGKGERMKPLTEVKPKPLLEAGGKPLIVWHLERLADAGLTEIVINHAWLGEQIEAQLGNGQQFGVSIEYSREQEPLETAGGVQKALPMLGSAPFLVISADIWTDYPYYQLSQIELGDLLAHLVMVPNAPHHPGGDFAIENGNLRLAEGFGGSASTYSGIGVYSPSMFASLPPGKTPLRTLLDDGVSAGKIGAEEYDGLWWDIGTPERLDALDNFLKGC